jgi:hypothetical protein
MLVIGITLLTGTTAKVANGGSHDCPPSFGTLSKIARAAAATIRRPAMDLRP